MNKPKQILQKLNKNQRNEAKKNLGKRYLRIVKSSLEKITNIINGKEYLDKEDINKIDWSLNWLYGAKENLKSDQEIDKWYEVYQRLLAHGIDDQSDFTNWCFCEDIFKDILEKTDEK